jgi:hypothetical protein
MYRLDVLANDGQQSPELQKSQCPRKHPALQTVFDLVTPSQSNAYVGCYKCHAPRLDNLFHPSQPLLHYEHYVRSDPSSVDCLHRYGPFLATGIQFLLTINSESRDVIGAPSIPKPFTRQACIPLVDWLNGFAFSGKKFVTRLHLVCVAQWFVRTTFEWTPHDIKSLLHTSKDPHDGSPVAFVSDSGDKARQYRARCKEIEEEVKNLSLNLVDDPVTTAQVPTPPLTGKGKQRADVLPPQSGPPPSAASTSRAKKSNPAPSTSKALPVDDFSPPPEFRRPSSKVVPVPKPSKLLNLGSTLESIPTTKSTLTIVEPQVLLPPSGLPPVPQGAAPQGPGSPHFTSTSQSTSTTSVQPSSQTGAPVPSVPAAPTALPTTAFEGTTSSSGLNSSAFSPNITIQNFFNFQATSTTSLFETLVATNVLPSLAHQPLAQPATPRRSRIHRNPISPRAHLQRRLRGFYRRRPRHGSSDNEADEER